MASHTPGPWAVRQNHGNHYGMREVVGPAVKVVGFTIATDVDEDKARRINADCALIAAAPALLDALKFFVGQFDTDRSTWPDGDVEALVIAHAAIDKAEGRSC